MANILLLGATGRTGQWFLKEALAKNYNVTALVRDKSKLTAHPNLQILEGKPTDKALIIKALQSCTVVVNLLNISRTSDFPWAPLRAPKTLISDFGSTIIELSKQYKIDKYVTCSAWGAGQSRAQLPFWFKGMIDYTNIKYGYADHQHHEEILEASNLNYVVVRPSVLTNNRSIKPVQISQQGNPKVNLFISRRNVALCMLQMVETNLYDRAIVEISEE